MSETFSKVEVITGVARRRRFPMEQKLAVVAETMQPGMSISYVARRHGLSPSLVFRWRRLMSEGGKEAIRPTRTSCRLRRPASSRSASASSNVCWVARPWRSRSSRRRWTLHGQKNRPCCRARQVREIPGEDGRRHIQVARSNIIERRDGSRPQRGPQSRAGDLDLIADIRHLVDQRPTYGYRRIAALLKRERRSAGRRPSIPSASTAS